MPIDLIEYIEIAISIDNVLYKRKIEKKGNYGHTYKKNQPNDKKKRSNGNTLQGTYLGPIELDVIYRQGPLKKKGACFNYSKEGHYSKDYRQLK